MADYATLFGLLGGGFSLLGGLTYLPPIFGRDLLLRPTGRRSQPVPATWLAWAVVGAMTVVTYDAAGAGATLWIAIALLIEYVAVTLASVYARAADLHHLANPRDALRKLGFGLPDLASLAGVALSALFWVVSGSAFIALMLMILTDFCGAWLTIKHAYEAPREEPVVAWVLTVVGDIFGLFAITDWSFTEDAFGVWSLILYWTVANSFILLLVLRGRVRSPLVPLPP